MTKKVVSETMSNSVITIQWNETMETAHHRMRDLRLRHLPVLNEGGELVGMLSDRDVQRSMISQVRHDSSSALSSETIAFDPESRVRDYMGWPVLSVERNTDVRAVAERMLSEKVSALVVKNGSRIVGIVSTDDLLRVLIDLLQDPKTPARWTLEELISDASHRIEGILI